MDQCSYWTFKSVTLSAHHASSLAPTENLPVIRALLPLLYVTQIRHPMIKNGNEC